MTTHQNPTTDDGDRADAPAAERGAPNPAALPVFTEPVRAIPDPLASTNPWASAPASSNGTSPVRTSSSGAAFGVTRTDDAAVGSVTPSPGWTAYSPHQPYDRPDLPPVGYAPPAGPVVHDPGVDWTLVATLRGQVSEQLSRAVAEERDLPKELHEELARRLTLEAIDQTMTEWTNSGRPTLSSPQRAALARAVSDSLFRLGRLQPLVEDERVENININGYDDVELELTDGTVIPGPPVAESDQHLINDVVFLASRSEVNARSFSEAQPAVHLRLDDGSRLAAVAWVSPRPQLTIRRHRLVKVTLQELVHGGLLDPVAASLLAAAVRARLSIVISGAPGAGKTTLLRALAACIHPRERIATIETEYELHLHEYRPRTWAWEARPGTGEVGPDGRQAGEYTLSQAVYDVVRFNVWRVIVGEVRGEEVIPLLKNLENGAGSLSTTHARNATAAIRKLVTCGMAAGPQWTHPLMTEKLAESIDLVVHLELTDTDELDSDNGAPRRPRRRVAEIIAVGHGDTPGTFATTHIFDTDLDGVLVPGTLPDEFRRLERHGFDLAAFTAAQGSPRLGVVS